MAATWRGSEKKEDPTRSQGQRKRYTTLEVVVRIIEYHIPGFRPARLLTTLLDPQISAKELVLHYPKRWDIEIAFDEIKTHQYAILRGQAPTLLRSKTPELVEQELYAVVIVYNLVRELDSSILITNIDLGPTFSVYETRKQDINQPRAYLYTHINAPESVTWTVGASYDDYDQDPLEETSFNPKFGVQWDVTEALRLRVAAFKVLKPALVNNRTIEPTQVAGFNQFFDDINATQSWRYGGGFDWRLR